MKFIERTSAPTENTKYYKTNNPFYPTYSMFKHNGNCTDYVYFRFKEANGLGKVDLPTSNAENWIYRNNTYEEGNVPKVASIMVYSKGKVGYAKDGAGHVQFVEKINYNNDGSIKSIEVSSSGYNSYLWKRKTLKPPYTMTGYNLVGFIYSPTEFEVGIHYPGTYPTLPSRTYFKKGDSGVNVKYLQELLNWLNGSKLAIDGIIGNKTIAQVKIFQKNNKLTQDGLFGKKCLSTAKEIRK